MLRTFGIKLSAEFGKRHYAIAIYPFCWRFNWPSAWQFQIVSIGPLRIGTT